MPAELKGSAGDPVVPEHVRAAVREFVGRVTDRFSDRVRNCRLFGSYARGDWDADSDVDVLVVVGELRESERREVFELAWEAYPDHEVHLSPLALSEAEWKMLQRREYRIAREIQQDGHSL